MKSRFVAIGAAFLVLASRLPQAALPGSLASTKVPMIVISLALASLFAFGSFLTRRIRPTPAFVAGSAFVLLGISVQRMAPFLKGAEISYGVFTLLILLLAVPLTPRGPEEKSLAGKALAAYTCFQAFSILFLQGGAASFRSGAIELARGSTPTLGYQGITLEFCLLSLLFFCLGRESSNTIWNLCGIASFGVALYGGGRGEILGLILVLGMLFLGGKRLAGSLSFLVAIGIVWFFLPESTYTNLVQDSAFAVRMQGVLEGRTMGLRDVLWLEAFETWTHDTTSTVFGVGANGFQYLRGYPFGFYPHNFVVEMVVTTGLFGLFLTGYLLFRFLVTSVQDLRTSGSWSTFLASYLLFFLLRWMKSGSIWQAWIVWIGLIWATGPRPQVDPEPAPETLLVVS